MARLGKMEKELLKSARSKQATVLYPFTKEGLNIPEGLRGKWEYKYPDKCTGCKICHFARCILCGQCVESCPRDVLALTGEFEMAYLSRSDMVIE
jgi:formate hydrogenlyase subunit 6/NADH:ubiquinone oxidoreductase subunit I